MSQLALASLDAAGASARWAHDIRNALATVGLHLETLERLSGTRGREIAHSAHALMSRAAAMCNEAMAQGSRTEGQTRRKPFDIAKTIVQVANLLRPTAPEGFEIRVAGNGSFVVLADPQDTFRILFNLVHNAMAIARRRQETCDRMTNVTLLIERSGATVKVRIADDGPGLPVAVRIKLFRRQKSGTGGSGIGLSIARELADQNGGVLQLAKSARGTTFVLELPSGSAMVPTDGAFRSLGKRAQH
jgi:two-component system, OmpR family, sensor kinase